MKKCNTNVAVLFLELQASKKVTLKFHFFEKASKYEESADTKIYIGISFCIFLYIL